MSGSTNFPTSLDDDVSLFDVTDGVSTYSAGHHNNLKEAVKAVERKLGIVGSAAPTSLDYRLGNPTGSHFHDGASGQGARLNPTTIPAPSGAVASALSLHDHLMNANVHSNSQFEYVAVQVIIGGTLASGLNRGIPIQLGRPFNLESAFANLRTAPSGATTVIDVNFGPTSMFQASQPARIMFRPGATSFPMPSPLLISLPSGAVITADIDLVGSSHPGDGLSITFLFRS